MQQHSDRKTKDRNKKADKVQRKKGEKRKENKHQTCKRI